MKYNILITGGAGFIGSNLCEHFLSKGHSVFCLDNFSTGHRKNITNLLNNPEFTLIEGDIRNLDTCLKATKNVDYVLHHAALGSVPRSILDPVTTTEVNINGFLNMLIASRDSKIKRFIYAVSSSVYGDSTDLPKVEDNIGSPLSPYAITKYTNELYAEVFSNLFKIECIGLRYFNVFGKNQDPNGSYAAVIPKWVKQMINNERPVINGNGDFSRDFTYIGNVIIANERSIEIDSKKIINKRGNQNQIFNIAYGSNTTLNELFKALKEYLSKYNTEVLKITPIYGSTREGDIPHSIASIKKAKKILNYNPKYSAYDGIALTCEWYWKNLK